VTNKQTERANVKKYLLAAAALIMLGGTAYAQFKAEPPKSETPSMLECAIIKSTDNDCRDPIYKITVTINSDPQTGHFQSMDVVHTATSGATHDRSQQYVGGRTWQAQGRPTRMVGKAWETQDFQWWYSEKQTKYEVSSYAMLAKCHTEEGD
jgi:hypothetical protein